LWVVVSRASIGLVVVGYDSDEVWPDFFSALASSKHLPDSVIVVENSPRLPTPDFSGMPFPVHVLHQPSNPGYGGAANEGVKLVPASCSAVVVCNPDVVLQPTTIGELADGLESRKDVGVVGPTILTGQGNVYPSARSFPGITMGIGHALFANLWKSNPWTRQYFGDYGNLDTRIVDWLSGSFLMFRREAFDSVMGFDPGYFMFLEDVDICLRLKRQGWTSLYVPHARLLHTGSHATKKQMPEMVRVHHDSAHRFLKTLYNRPFHAPLRVVLGWGLAIRKRFAPRRYETLGAD